MDLVGGGEEEETRTRQPLALVRSGDRMEAVVSLKVVAGVPPLTHRLRAPLMSEARKK